MFRTVTTSCFAFALFAGLASAQISPTTQPALPRVGLSAALFATSDAGKLDNASLMWAAADETQKFELQRSTNSAGFETVYSGTGVSFKDYGLAEGNHVYRLIAHQGEKTLESNLAAVTPTALPGGLKRFSNQVQNDESLTPEGVKVGDTYYGFRFVREDKALKHLLMRTSTDGRTWTDVGPVMETADHPDLADCKFEAENYFYDKVHDRIVLWGHWEPSGPRYGAGKAVVATAKPGEKFTIHHIYNPLGVQVRDMTVFIDDDQTGYLVAASNLPGEGANKTLYLFKLNDTYTDVVEIVGKVMENGYREAPCVVKRDGIYYLFFSQAAGWYPSQGGYLSSRSMYGPWSEPRKVASPSTFSSQSGHVATFGSSHRVMMSNRWIRGEGTNRQVAMPVRFADGFAFEDFAPTLLVDESRDVIVPLDSGVLLSQDKPVQASIDGAPNREAGKAFDGDYFSSFQSETKQWPFELTVDLGRPCVVRNVQVSWFLHKGSEAFYTYTIEGSADGKTWSVLADRSDAADPITSKTYGFSSIELTPTGPVRYVKLKVLRAHLHNNPNNWYPPTVYEMKVFGEPTNRN